MTALLPFDNFCLSGGQCGHVKVSANWRVTFRFVGRDAETVDYEDYH